MHFGIPNAYTFLHIKCKYSWFLLYARLFDSNKNQLYFTFYTQNMLPQIYKNLMKHVFDCYIIYPYIVSKNL